MSFAMAGTFLASDGLLYYIFWELALIDSIYFIALIWGNGDTDQRKKAVVKFFIYTLAGSLFMLVAFVYMYQAKSFIRRFIQMNLTATEQLWIFLAFFLAYAIKIPFLSTLGKQMCIKSTNCWDHAFIWYHAKNGIVQRYSLAMPLAPLAAKSTCTFS
jgi:NADH-quinone oxidoreductase subunit M